MQDKDSSLSFHEEGSVGLRSLGSEEYGMGAEKQRRQFGRHLFTGKDKRAVAQNVRGLKCNG